MTLARSGGALPGRLFAAALGTALAGGVALAAWAVGDPVPLGDPLSAASMPAHPFTGPRGGLPGLPILPRGPMLDHVLDRIDASALQRTQVRQIVDAAAAATRADVDAARADHDELARLFAQPEVDASALEALRQRMLARQDVASRRAAQSLLDVGRVLGGDQRARLVAVLRERHEHRPRPDAPPPPDGR